MHQGSYRSGEDDKVTPAPRLGVVGQFHITWDSFTSTPNLMAKASMAGCKLELARTQHGMVLQQLALLQW